MNLNLAAVNSAAFCFGFMSSIGEKERESDLLVWVVFFYEFGDFFMISVFLPINIGISVKLGI